MCDAKHLDFTTHLVDDGEHPVRTSTRAPDSVKRRPKQLPHSLRVLNQGSSDELDDCC